MKKLLAITVMAFMLCLTGLIMPGEAQAQRFVDKGNGTVTDTMTNLMWTKDANMFGRVNWHNAMSRCEFFSTGGWRLPSRDELVAIYHAIQGGHPFTGVQSSNYWSSSTFADYTKFAWGVRMGNGGVNAYNKTDNGHVWPVSDGQ